MKVIVSCSPKQNIFYHIMWLGILGGRKAVRSGGCVRLVSLCVLILDSCRCTIDTAPLWFTISLFYIWNREGVGARHDPSETKIWLILSPRPGQRRWSALKINAASFLWWPPAATDAHSLKKDAGARKKKRHLDTGPSSCVILHYYY